MLSKARILAITALTLSLFAVTKIAHSQSQAEPTLPQAISGLEAEPLNPDEMKETRGQVIDKYRPRPRNCIWGVCSGDWDDRLGPLMYRPDQGDTTFQNH